MKFCWKLEARAKLNWYLEITGLRADGYHLLDTVMQSLTLSDRLFVAIVPTGLRHELEQLPISERLQVLSDMAEREQGDLQTALPTKEAYQSLLQNVNYWSLNEEADFPFEQNLLSKGLQCYVEARGLTCFTNSCVTKKHTALELILALEKHIPSQAGLGGGSSDVAALLYHFRAMEMALSLDWPALNWIELCAKIGADVPFLFEGGRARCRGIGEVLEPLEDGKRYAVLVAKPSVEKASTPVLFKRYDEALEKGEVELSHEMNQSYLEAIRRFDWTLIREEARNDFEPFQSHLPWLRRFKQRAYAEGALLAGLSGSGASVFAIFEQEVDRDALAKQLTNQANLYPCWTDKAR